MLVQAWVGQHPVLEGGMVILVSRLYDALHITRHAP
jgi:hypothetical protein